MRSFQYKTIMDTPFKDIPFDELGAAGWELVAAVPSMVGGLTKYIFKKQDPEVIDRRDYLIPESWLDMLKVTC